MCRILFHIPAKIHGISVFGPGLLLAVWVLFSVGLMVWLVRRQGFNADTLGYVPLLLLVGAIIWWLLPAVCDDKGFPIRGFGVMNLVAVVVGAGLAIWRGRRVGLHSDLILSMAFWMLLPGIVGARVFYVIKYWPSQYWPAYQQGVGALLVEVISVTKGGLVAYGALIGGMLGLLLFARKYRLPGLALADLVAPSIVLGQALGRIGCLLNGCCFGGPCELPWAVTFPKGDWPYIGPAYQAQVERGQMYGIDLGRDPDAAPLLRSVQQQSPAGQGGLRAGDRLQSIGSQEVNTAKQAQRILWERFNQHRPVVLQAKGRDPVRLPAIAHPPRSLPVHPTQVYSSINAFLLFLLLLAYDRFRRRDGELFALLISVYPATRFLLEMIRTDENPVFGTGLTIAQNISLLLLVCAVGLWFYILRQPRGKAFG